MNEVTRILDAIEQGHAEAAELLPLVYQELRRLAAHKMTGEAGGHTLQATALVHEAWIRLAGVSTRPQEGALAGGQRGEGEEKGGRRYQNREHFFAAAAEAMRRILVDHARRKKSQKRGSGAELEEFNEANIILSAPPDELLAVHEALDGLAVEDAQAAELVKLRYFVGMTMEEAASALGLAPRTTERLWTYARAWLKREMRR